MIEPPATLQHAWQSGAHCAEHGPHIQIESEVPIVIGRVQDRTVVHKTRTVKQCIRRRRFSTPFATSASSAYIHAERCDIWRFIRESLQSFIVDITRKNLWAPSAAIISADARPIPCPAAVTSTRFPLSLCPDTRPLPMFVCANISARYAALSSQSR